VWSCPSVLKCLLHSMTDRSDIHDAVPLHLTETHSLCDSGLQILMAFCRINVKRNGNIKLILSVLVLRYKVAS